MLRLVQVTPLGTYMSSGILWPADLQSKLLVVVLLCIKILVMFCLYFPHVIVRSCPLVILCVFIVICSYVFYQVNSQSLPREQQSEGVAPGGMGEETPHNGLGDDIEPRNGLGDDPLEDDNAAPIPSDTATTSQSNDSQNVGKQPLEASPTDTNQSEHSHQIEAESESHDSGNMKSNQSECSDQMISGSHDPGDMENNNGDMPSTSGCGPQQTVTDRMQYLTESCSYGDSDDCLTLSTPASQMTSSNNDITYHDEDPLGIIDKGNPPTITDGEVAIPQQDSLAISDEGNSIPVTEKEDSPCSVLSSLARQKLHDSLQRRAALQYPAILSSINDIIDKARSLSNSEYDDVTMILNDALDYSRISRN